MKRLSSLFLLACICLVMAAAAQSRKSVLPAHGGTIRAFAHRHAHGSAQRVPLFSAPPQLPASAAKNIIPADCPPEAVGAVCGYVPVPLDRKHPENGTIQIYFELYPQSDPGPAESAILFNEGGPGMGTSVWRDDAFYLVSQNLDKHDLLLIDDRGRGFSGTLECDELQHGLAPFAQAQADCAAQLGDAASRYGTGDIAKDTEAVRAALGYDQVDYIGISYGGADVVAYASRFGEHLRSVVLDSPYASHVIKEFGLEEHYRAQTAPRMVSLICLRSPACSADHPSPAAELEALIKAVRVSPVEGDAYDASGNLLHVRIDETFLFNNMITNPIWNFNNTGELLAAATALRRGDSMPLLRLGAEGYTLVAEGAETYTPLPLDWGDPTIYSVGARHATFCSDMRAPWDWDAQPAERQDQFDRAVRSLPRNYFAPFSPTAATSLLFSFTRQCLWWEKPAPSSPVQPPHATFPNVPTLVLSGDLDDLVPTEVTSDVAALFPNSTQVAVAEVGHASLFWSRCLPNLASQFIETLQVGDTSCTQTPETVWPAMGRFPALARNAQPAEIDSNGHNQIGTAERKVVTVAVAAATDAMQRSLMNFGDGVGLRGGTFHTDYSDSFTTTLTDCAFAQDVTVNGTVTWSPGDNMLTWGYPGDFTFVADLVVSGPGTKGGTLHVEGKLDAPGAVGKFQVSGTLGGRRVAVLVPEA